MIEGAVQLVDGVRPEGVAHLGAVEGYAHRAVLYGTMVRDVGEVEAGDISPGRRVEDL
jgi:hypothetical protein